MRPSPLVSATLAAACFVAAGAIALGDIASSTDAPTAAGPTTVEPSVPDALPTPASTATPTPEPPPPVPADRAALVADLQLMLADPEFDSGAARSVVVLDEFGRVVVEASPTAALLPASTMKLVTAAAVLQLHRPGDRLETPVHVTGPVSSRGTLLGDVVVTAGGDPVLSTAEYHRFVFPARPITPTAEIVDLLRAAGIEAVDGDVVADPGRYADQRRPAGWRDEYLQDFNGRSITGLTVDAGLNVVVNHPRETWGNLRPEDLEDEGIRILLAPDPVVHAAEVFREEFARARMSVRGDAVVGPLPADARPIGALRSPPIERLLSFMIKESDNHLADTLLREAGAAVSGRSTWESSAAAVRTLLAELGIDLTDAVIADGSGLSRDDLLSARTLAMLDQRMSASEVGDVWASLQAVAGEDGTLRSRLAGTIADGRFRGKTGTLNDVRALVGAVEGPDGARFHVAVLGNGGEVWRINTLTDQIILRLTRSLWCSVAEPPADVAVACA